MTFLLFSGYASLSFNLNLTFNSCQYTKRFYPSMLIHRDLNVKMKVTKNWGKQGSNYVVKIGILSTINKLSKIKSLKHVVSKIYVFATKQ